MQSNENLDLIVTNESSIFLSFFVAKRGIKVQALDKRLCGEMISGYRRLFKGQLFNFHFLVQFSKIFPFGLNPSRFCKISPQKGPSN